MPIVFHVACRDVSYNGLGGTLPTAIAAIPGSNFAGNCFPGHPPYESCDGYFMGAANQDCTHVCSGVSMSCSPLIDTTNSANLMQSLLAPQGVTCTTAPGTGYVIACAVSLSDRCLCGARRWPMWWWFCVWGVGRA